jgi:hypothetical protein
VTVLGRWLRLCRCCSAGLGDQGNLARGPGLRVLVSPAARADAGAGAAKVLCGVSGVGDLRWRATAARRTEHCSGPQGTALFIDDLDGSQAEATVQSGLDGNDCEIGLDTRYANRREHRADARRNGSPIIFMAACLQIPGPRRADYMFCVRGRHMDRRRRHPST